jgi:hypothetical protein
MPPMAEALPFTSLPRSNSLHPTAELEANRLYVCRLDETNICRGSWGTVVPIYDLLRRQGVFAPEEVAMLGQVFGEVLKTLGLADREDLVTEMVAKKLIELASPGLRDPERLKALTVEAFVHQQLKTPDR